MNNMTSKERFSKLLEDNCVENIISDNEYKNRIDNFYLTIESYLENYKDSINIYYKDNIMYINISNRWLFRVIPKEKVHFKLDREYKYSTPNNKFVNYYKYIKSDETIVGSVEIDCKYGTQEIVLVNNIKGKYTWKELDRYGKFNEVTSDLFYDMLMEVCF